MKRILAITMTLAMLLGLMTIGASATYANDGTKPQYYDGTGVADEDKATEKGTNGGGVNQTNEYGEGDTVAIGTGEVKVSSDTSQASITHVYAVNFSMPDSLSYTFGTSTQYIWNPETLIYDVIQAGENLWTSGGQGQITVRNYSDLPVDVTASFDDTNRDTKLASQTINVYFTAEDAQAGTTTDATATVSLDATHAVVDDDVSQTLANAVGAAMKSDVIYFRIDGSLSMAASELKLGDIVLTFTVPTT